MFTEIDGLVFVAAVLHIVKKVKESREKCSYLQAMNARNDGD